MTTRKEIEELARDNPVVHYCVTAYLRGQVSWEQAMMEAVAILAQINKEQFDLLVQNAKVSLQPPPFFLTMRAPGRGDSPAEIKFSTPKNDTASED